MIILNMANNNFIGSIPDSFGSLIDLHVLTRFLCSVIDLHMLIIYNNKLSGTISDTLKNCKVITFWILGSKMVGYTHSFLTTPAATKRYKMNAYDTQRELIH